MIAGSVTVRIDHTADDRDEGDGDDTAAPRRIEYVIAVPGDPRRLSIDRSVQPTAGFDTEATSNRCPSGTRTPRNSSMYSIPPTSGWARGPTSATHDRPWDVAGHD